MIIKPQDAERLKSKIGDPVWPRDCWPWLGAHDGRGYGSIGINGIVTQAHRVSYTLFVKPIAERMLICHDCDNHDCVNPHHLFEGTHQDNRNDAKSKGRIPSLIGQKNHKAKITEDQTLDILRLHNDGLNLHEIISLVDPTISWDIVSDIVKGKTWKHLGRGTQ